MTINQKEEAMGYQRIGSRQVFLLTGLVVLLWSLTGAIGCGSNETSPSSRQDKKPAASSTAPLVKEILPEPRSGATVPMPSALGRADANVSEVIPPDRAGGQGVTATEVKSKAMAAKPIDPKLLEVIPPATPGGRGLTEEDIQAKEVKPTFPVVPPSGPR